MAETREAAPAYRGNHQAKPLPFDHSYAMDYGANARGYLDAFFQNIQWNEVNRRTQQANAR